MTYKIFNNGRGVITSREPELVSGDLEFLFNGAPEGATAIIIAQNGTSYYRELKERRCSVPSKYFEGSVEVGVAVMNGKIPTDRWSCEGLRAIKQPGGQVLILPDDGDIPGIMAMMRVEMDELRQENKKLKEAQAALRRDFETIKQGYNLI